MLRNVFAATMWMRRRAVAWWAGGTFLYLLMIGSVFPTVRDNAADFDKLMESYPDFFKSMIGMSGDFSFGTGGGFLQAEVFSFLGPLLLLIFAVGMGAQAVAGEEESGTLDLLLSGPITRRSVLLQELGAMVTLTTGLGVVMFLALLGAGRAFNMQVAAANLAGATLSSVLLALVFGSLALAVGSATGSRGIAIGAASALALAAFLLSSLADLVPSLGTAQKYLPWYYYGAAQPVRNGIEWAHAGALAAMAVGLVAAGDLLFERRDVAV